MNDLKKIHTSVVGRDIPLPMEFDPKELTYFYAYNPYIDQRVPIYEMFSGKKGNSYINEYFTIEALEAGIIGFHLCSFNEIDYIAYSKNSGQWVTTTNDKQNDVDIIVEVEEGDIVKWKGLGGAFVHSPSGYSTVSSFGSTCNVNIYGNIMSLLCEAPTLEFSTELPDNSARFSHLFNGASINGESLYFNVISAENLVIPCANEEYMCYNMFGYCNTLITPPSILPATTLAPHCYQSMFIDCNNLATAPVLPAVTMYDSCYSSMFNGCASLTTAPELPATTLAGSCYNSMFAYCASLTTAPALPAMTLAYSCYNGMFQGCTSLVNAPELPATTLAVACYNRMFGNCTSLEVAPALPATTLEQQCYSEMFLSCTSLTSAPILYAEQLNYNCYRDMFSNCSALSEITCLATDISLNDCTTSWTQGVSATGTFIKNSSMNNWTTGVNGIPSGWTVNNYPTTTN